MRILAIETATEACSIALFEGDELLDARHVIIGRGHVEQLVPMIAELPDKGRAAEIRVSLGPGSFTGTRIGLSVGRALAIVWESRVRGYPTLALVAACARAGRDAAVDAAMAGGHGEFYFQSFAAQGLPLSEHASIAPAEAAAQSSAPLVAGTRANELVALRGSGEALVLLPDAKLVAALPEEVFTDRLAPLYGRPPDARLPAVR